MPKGHEILRMRFASELYFIDLVQNMVQKMLEKSNVVEDEVFWVSLSVREAVINSIKHGNHFDPAKYVDFAISMHGQRFQVQIQDEGDGFEIETIPNPLDEENLLKPSGRGIFYIRSFMDRVAFRRTRSGMKVIMEKNLTCQS